MSPTAVYPESVNSAPIQSKGPALVIGSLATAQDGKYQSLIGSLEGNRQVDRQVLDRLMDGAATLTPSVYSSVHVTLSISEYQTLLPNISALLSQLFSGLTPLGTLHLLSLSSVLQNLPSELTLAGFSLLSARPTDDFIIAQKPADVPDAHLSLKDIPTLPSGTNAAAVALPRRRTDPDRKSFKKALWSLSPSTPPIDSESLLTPEDRERPVPTCEPFNAGASRRKKACKNCSCGLAELEAEELKQSSIVVLDGSENGIAMAVPQSEKERLLSAAKTAPKATSSCGSCFLGDAFRCASCPYLGLPAFRPGEKVEINLGMDDI